MTFSIFRATEPPSNSLYGWRGASQSSDQIESLRAEITSRFDSFNPKFSNLATKLRQIRATNDTNVHRLSSELNSSLKSCQNQMPDIRTSAMNLSRRIQALSLHTQSVTILEGPRQIQGVRNDFESLRDQSDKALKNVAALARSFNGRMNAKHAALRKLGDIGVAVEAAEKSLPKLSVKLREVAEAVKGVRKSLSENVERSLEKVRISMEPTFHDAEGFLSSVEEKIERKLAETNDLTGRIQMERLEMQSSLKTVSGEMKKKLSSTLETLKKSITDAESESFEKFSSIHEEMIGEMKVAEIELSGVKKRSMLEEIEYDRELNEIERLMNEIERIRHALEFFQGEPFDLGTDSEDDDIEDFQTIPERHTEQSAEEPSIEAEEAPAE